MTRTERIRFAARKLAEAERAGDESRERAYRWYLQHNDALPERDEKVSS